MTENRNVPPALLCQGEEWKDPTKFIFRNTSCSRGTQAVSFQKGGRLEGPAGNWLVPWQPGIFCICLVQRHRESAPKRVLAEKEEHLPSAS